MRVALGSGAVYALRILGFGIGIPLYGAKIWSFTAADFGLALALALAFGTLVFSSDRKWRREHRPLTELRPGRAFAITIVFLLLSLGADVLHLKGFLGKGPFFPGCLGLGLIFGSLVHCHGLEGFDPTGPARK